MPIIDQTFIRQGYSIFTDHEYGTIIKYIPIAVAVFDRNMNYIAYSQKWVEDYRLDNGSSILGRSHYDIFPEITDGWKQIHQRSLSGEIISEEADAFKRIDGSVQYINWEVRPWYQNDETVGGIIITTIDVTGTIQKKNIENINQLISLNNEIIHEKNRYKTLMEHASDGIFIMSLESGKLIEYSLKTQELLGYTHDEMQSLSVLDWDRQLHSTEEYRQIVKLLEHGPIDIEREHTRKNGTTYIASITAVLINMNQETFVYASARDITNQKTIENRLLSLNKKLDHLAQNAPGVVYTFQLFPDGRSCFPYASNHIYDIYGVTPDDVKTDAAKVYSVLYPEDLNRVSLTIKKSFDELGIWEDEYRVIHPEKGMIWAKGMAKPEKQSDGSVLWYGYIFEITDQKLAEISVQNAKHYYEMLLENASDAIHILNKSGDLIAYSRSFSTHLGYEYQETKYLKLKDWEALLSPQQQLSYIQKCLKSPATFQTKHRRKNGTTVDVEVNAKGIELDNQLYLYASARDITEAVRIKNELIIAKESAEHATKTKSQFLANMSHEIRTPLNGIIGLIDLSLKNQPNEATHDYLIKARKSSKALLYVINDILDFSKIEAGKLNLTAKPFLLMDVIDDIQAIFESSMESSSLRFDITIDPSIPNIVLGDSFRLTQIFSNLISNALKFTEEGAISVSIKKIKKKANSVRILCEVRDTGIGIKPEMQEKLFHPFVQSESSSTGQKGGTGLGLSITKSLVEMMHGDIWVESEYAKGSKFSFIIDLKIPNKAELAEIEESESDTKNLNHKFHADALLVDDNDINLLVAQKKLEELGLNVITASNGYEAIAHTEKNNFDIIFIDIHMPEIDGYETSKRIRKINASVPIIALSAAVMEQDIRNVFLSGMNEHLSKPIQDQKLIAILLRFLKPCNIEIKDSQSGPESSTDESVNVRELQKLFNNHDEVVRLLQIYATKYGDFCKQIHSTEIGSDSFKQSIHAIKGASGSIEANLLHALASKIESEDDHDEIAHLLEFFCKELQRTLETIDHFIRNKTIA